MEKKQIIVVAGVLVKKGKVLLIQRNYPGEAFHGKWEFPGGKIDFGESPEVSMLREIKEETGLNCKIKRLIPLIQSFRWTSGDIDHHLVLIPYECKIISGEISKHDHGVNDIKLVDIDKVRNMDTIAGTNEIIEKLKDL